MTSSIELTLLSDEKNTTSLSSLTIRKRRRSWLFASAVAVAVFLVGCGFYALCNSISSPHTRNSIATTLVQKSNLVNTIPSTDTLQPKDFLYVGAQGPAGMKRVSDQTEMNLVKESLLNCGLIAVSDIRTFMIKRYCGSHHESRLEDVPPAVWR